jgi:hypothetical protein
MVWSSFVQSPLETDIPALNAAAADYKTPPTTQTPLRERDHGSGTPAWKGVRIPAWRKKLSTIALSKQSPTEPMRTAIMHVSQYIARVLHPKSHLAVMQA